MINVCFSVFTGSGCCHLTHIISEYSELGPLIESLKDDFPEARCITVQFCPFVSF